MNFIIKQVQNNLIWIDLVLAYSEFYKSATKLIDALLALQNETLFNDSDIWFRLFHNYKIFIAKLKQLIIVIDIQIHEIYYETMNSLKILKWIKMMNLKIKQNHERKIYILISLSKSQKMLENKWIYTVKTDKNDNISKFKTR